MFNKTRNLFSFKAFVLCTLSILILSNSIPQAQSRDDLPAEQPTDPAYFVRELIQGCKNIIQLHEKGNYTQVLGNFLNENMKNKTISSFVMGRHWRDLSDHQRDQVVQALGPFIINQYLIYLDEFLRYQDSIEIVDSVYRKNLKDYLVRTIISMPDEENLMISWRVFLDPDTKQYKVSDIIVHRMSLLLTIRDQLNEHINHHGIEKTIDLMTQKRQDIENIEKQKPLMRSVQTHKSDEQ